MTSMQLARGFWTQLSVRRKRQLAILIILMVLAAFAEILSLGAILPFLGVLTDPRKVFEHPEIGSVLTWLRIGTPEDLLLPFTLAFVLAALLAGLMRLLLLYVSTKVSFAIGADFSYEIYRRTLYQPYSVHVARNSSEVISGVTTKVQSVIHQFLLPILTLISSAVLLISLSAALVAIDPWMSIIAFIGFGMIYGIVILMTRKKLAIYSSRIAKELTQVVKVLQEGLGGIRDVLIEGAQDSYAETYRRADVPLRYAQGESLIIGGFPRFVAEPLGMAFIAGLAYLVAYKEGNISNTIALLGALALGAQRILPLMQQGYQAFVQLRSSHASLEDALNLLRQETRHSGNGDADVDLRFQKGIELRNVGFRYGQTASMVLKNVNLTIPRGSRIGFIGVTGSGKSTLLDIIMGLLPATSGLVLIDGVPLDGATRRSWQRRIAHVPQSIYLTDASIEENIAFGVPRNNIDRRRVRQAAQRAQIAEYIESMDGDYGAMVGERGVRLSGGQRQRIGIARALYKESEVMIFDEATSALDGETESAVMESLDRAGTQLTVLIIAHRLTTLRNCDQIVELRGGSIVRIGTYSEIVG